MYIYIYIHIYIPLPPPPLLRWQLGCPYPTRPAHTKPNRLSGHHTWCSFRHSVKRLVGPTPRVTGPRGLVTILDSKAPTPTECPSRPLPRQIFGSPWAVQPLWRAAASGSSPPPPRAYWLLAPISLAGEACKAETYRKKHQFIDLSHCLVLPRDQEHLILHALDFRRIVDLHQAQCSDTRHKCIEHSSSCAAISRLAARAPSRKCHESTRVAARTRT